MWSRWPRTAAALAFGFCMSLGTAIGLGSAYAESRLALVIGNSAYQTVPALPNPVNDARAMGDFLKTAGFEVMSVRDAGQAEMRKAIGEFADTVAGKGPETVALVFFAGHGLQVDGENYLVPVDAGIVREADVPFQAIRLGDIMKALAAVPSKVRIVMLDACRNNPFSEINKVTGKGLAIVDAPAGTIVSYATSPGSEALDGDGEHSPYTRAILSLAKEPGLPIEQAFKRVRFAVNDATERQQLPWESSSLTNDFSFFGGGGGAYALASTSPNAPAATPASASTSSPMTSSSASGRTSARSVDSWKRELQRRSPTEAYEIVVREDTVEAYQAFLALFPGQTTAPVVRTVVDRRNVMIAWYTATTTDTPTAYLAFLTAYPETDLTLTARRLMERARNRSLFAALPGGSANVCPCNLPTQPAQPVQQAPQPVQQQPEPPKPEQRATPVPTRSIEKKATKKEDKKKAKKEKEKPVKQARQRPPEDSAPPPQQQANPMPMMMPMMMGIGGGMMGGGMMGGGRSTGPGSYSTGGGRPPATSHTPTTTGGSYSTGSGSYGGGMRRY